MEKGDLDRVLSDLWTCRLPSESDTTSLLRQAIEVLGAEPNCISLRAPISVCGDIHGQFYDLLELFSVGGRPPEQSFVFLGDYVDRGYYSTETLLLLLALKARYPAKIHLLRGNHECQQVTEEYGFFEEVSRKYPNSEVYHFCIAVFAMLPLVAIIEDTVLCVHGGLSPSLERLADLHGLQRKQEPPQDGLFSDLLWSDPDEKISGFQHSERGAGFLFGADVTQHFTQQNNIQFICRAHQVADDGYKEFFGGLVYTVWSAPNYCYRGGNLASVLEITNTAKKKFKIFKEAPPSVRGKIPEAKLPQYFM
jgi:serine/threonine-protein phosphatase 4 catalytic subunit